MELMKSIHYRALIILLLISIVLAIAWGLIGFLDSVGVKAIMVKGLMVIGLIYLLAWTFKWEKKA